MLLLNNTHLKTISKLYKEKGNVILQLFKINPSKCIPMFLNRLKSKLNEWLEARKLYDETVKSIHKSNYLRAYDHYSQKFLAIDKKYFQKKYILENVVDLEVNDNEIISNNYHNLIYLNDKKFCDDINELIIKTIKNASYKSHIVFIL